ncbi:MAG: preprotein translocase subunit SecG [Kiritimatiellae bacterium]|nr:preprotein translocase subunit SecG [Kiritimatiellia bacterium]
MGILRSFLMFIEVLSSLMLVGIILMQKTKREGLGMAFGAGMGESLFGSRTGNVLTKTTIVLAVIFLVNTTLLAIIHPAVRMEESATDKYAEPPVSTTQPPPGQPGPGLPSGSEEPLPVDASDFTLPVAAPAGEGAPAGGPPAADVPLAMPVEVGPAEAQPGTAPPPPAAPAPVAPAAQPRPEPPVQPASPESNAGQ